MEFPRPLALGAFLPLAMALHLGAYALWPVREEGGPNAAGAGGLSIVTLAPADGSRADWMADLVAEWEAPPEALAPEAPALQPPVVPQTAPNPTPEAAPGPQAAPAMPLPPAAPEPLPSVPAEPKPDPKPDPKPEPKAAAKPAPKLPAKPAPKGEKPRPAAAQAEAQAAGAGGGAAAGQRGAAPEGSFSPAEIDSAMGRWKSRIQGRIVRALRPPEGLRGEVRLRLQVEIARTGALLSVRVAQSSGLPALDALCVAAVQRAAPFPPAPEALRDRAYAFPVPFRFTP